MSIKTVLLKKKIEKTASPMELFVAQQLYSVMEELVKATHEDSATTIKALTKELADKLYTYCQSMRSDIKKQTEKAINDVTAHGEKSKIPVAEVVAKIEADARKQISALTDEVSQMFARTLREIDKKVGPEGPQGKPGAKGTDGSPDTAEQVVSKVNKAKGVSINAIDGLAEQLKTIKKNAGAGTGKSGGGMGMPQHETKSVSSGTTSVSTTYPIAAGGRAAWLYYQGQFLVYGTHYTVNRNVISLTFDKVDSTFIDITYIRGS